MVTREGVSASRPHGRKRQRNSQLENTSTPGHPKEHPSALGATTLAQHEAHLAPCAAKFAQHEAHRAPCATKFAQHEAHPAPCATKFAQHRHASGVFAKKLAQRAMNRDF